MRFPRPFLTGFVVLAVLSACQTKPRASETAPQFELKDLSGKSVSLASFKGHPVMLDFWATWCGPCRMSIPMVQRFYMAHKDEGLVVLGMNMDDEASQVYPFVKQFHMTYPVLYTGGTSVAEMYGLDGIPTFILIDADGRIVQRYDGFRFDMVEDWERQFKRLSEKPKPQ